VITGNDQTITVENKHSLQTKQKDIAFNAGTDIALTAKQNIKLNAEGKDMSLTSGQDLIVEVGKDMSVKVIDGDSSITVQQGSISIDAANSINIMAEGGPITIEQGGGKIQGNTVTLEGNSVAVTGQSVQMMGGGGPAAVASKAVAAVAAATATRDIALHFVDAEDSPLTGESIALHFGNDNKVQAALDGSGKAIHSGAPAGTYQAIQTSRT
jgi:type VI secretion system secreted protein VgrG